MSKYFLRIVCAVVYHITSGNHIPGTEVNYQVVCQVKSAKGSMRKLKCYRTFFCLNCVCVCVCVVLCVLL